MTTMQLAKLSALGEAASTQAFSTKVGQQIYALKRLKPEQHGNRRLRRLFPILSSNASQYHHKHLARIFRVDGDSIQVLMQHFPGTLHSGGFEDAEDVAKVLVQSLKALRYLHRQNTLHLNIKPTNIMREESGNIRLADPLCFSPGTAAGLGINPDYRFFSAAQIDPRKAVSSACDLYSLAMSVAMTLNTSSFESHVKRCLDVSTEESEKSSSVPSPHFSTRTMKAGNSLVSLWSNWHCDIGHPNPSVSELDGSLPEGLAAVLNRMLDKDPKQRFQSADEVLKALSDPGVDHSTSESATAEEESRNWSAGVETVMLDGPLAGQARFSETEFEIETTGSQNVGERVFRLEPDGASWFLQVRPPGPFIVNNELKSGRLAVQHGDIFRLGPAGPEVLIHRNETDPERILLAAREAESRSSVSEDSVVAANRSGALNSNSPAPRQHTQASSQSWLSSPVMLVLITLVAAISVCALLYFALGGSS